MARSEAVSFTWLGQHTNASLGASADVPESLLPALPSTMKDSPDGGSKEVPLTGVAHPDHAVDQARHMGRGNPMKVSVFGLGYVGT